MSTWGEYAAKARALRNDPMIEAWIASYRESGSKYPDCDHCGFPHAPWLLCNSAAFGHFRLCGHWYYVHFSDVVATHSFMTKLGEGWGFHWRDGVYFKRCDDGAVEVRYFEEFNNTPQAKVWRIPSNEWASIVASMSAAGENAETFKSALDRQTPRALRSPVSSKGAENE